MHYISNSLYTLKQTISPWIPFLSSGNKDDICQVDPDITQKRSITISIMAMTFFTASVICFMQGSQTLAGYVGKLRNIGPRRIAACKVSAMLVALQSVTFYNDVTSWLSNRLTQSDQNLIKGRIDHLACQKIIEGGSADDAGPWLQQRPSAVKMLGTEVHSLCVSMLFHLNHMEEPLTADCRRYVISAYMALLKSRVSVSEKEITKLFDTRI